MLPLDLKIDKDGLLYYNDDRILVHAPLSIDDRNVSENRYYPSGFYRMNGNSDYIIKYCYTHYTKKEIKAIKEMLNILIQKQKFIPEVDFPIGYFSIRKRLSGQIIKYYPNGISLEHLSEREGFESIGKYYAIDDDNLRNLFLIFDEFLTIENKMFENGIYYLDINPGNIVLSDNQIKIIDFDSYYVRFQNKDLQLNNIMKNYCLLLKVILSKFNLVNEVIKDFNNFEEAKAFTKKLENNIRKGRQ